MKRAKKLRQRLLTSLLLGCLAAPLAACGGSQSQQQPAPQNLSESSASSHHSASSSEAVPAQESKEERSAASNGSGITAEQVKKFAGAHPEMIEVQVRYLEPLQQAESHAEGQMLLEQAMQELKEVVERHDLTLEEFKEIADAAGRDPNVRRQIEELLAKH
jgi:hypothetical protein